MDINQETLQLMKGAARRIEERDREYRAGSDEKQYTRVTAHIMGQLDHDGLGIVLPINHSKSYAGIVNAVYQHCIRAVEFVGDVDVVNYQGLVCARVRAAGIHHVHNLERRFMYYPQILARARVIPALDMRYFASSAAPRPKRDVKRVHTKAEQLLLYGIEKYGFTTKEAAEFLGQRTPTVRQHIRVLLSRGLIEREGKKYVPTIDELPLSETTRDQVLEYAKKHSKTRAIKVAKHLQISQSLAVHHLGKLTEIGLLKKIMPGHYEYVGETGHV